MYPNLNAEIKRRKKKHSDVATLLDINISTTSDKMTGKSDLKLKECKKIRNEWFPNYTIDYLFELEEELKEKEE